MAKKRTLSPQAAAIARSIALENEAVPRSSFGLDAADSGLKSANAAYRAKYLTAFDVPDRVTQYAKTVAPDLNKTSADMEKGYVVDPNSGDYVDPSNIVSLVGQRMQGGRDYLSRVTQSVGNLYDKGVQSSRFAVEDAQSAYDKADKGYQDRLSRARALADEERALANYEKQKQIDRRYSTGGGGGSGISLEDALRNPGTIGMYAAGVTKQQKEDGGFDFFDTKTGQPLRVEDVQSRIPGSSINDFLKGSFNPQDTARLNPPKEKTAGEQFSSDLQAGYGAFTQNKKARKQIKQRLYAAYPDKRKEIDQAIR